MSKKQRAAKSARRGPVKSQGIVGTRGNKGGRHPIQKAIDKLMAELKKK